MQAGQPCWDAAEAAVDRRDWPAGEVCDQCRYHHGGDARWHTSGHKRPPVEYSESQHADGKRLPVDAVQMAREHDDLLRHMPRHFEAHPEKFIQLAAEDDN